MGELSPHAAGWNVTRDSGVRRGKAADNDDDDVRGRACVATKRGESPLGRHRRWAALPTRLTKSSRTGPNTHTNGPKTHTNPKKKKHSACSLLLVFCCALGSHLGIHVNISARAITRRANDVQAKRVHVAHRHKPTDGISSAKEEGGAQNNAVVAQATDGGASIR